MKIIPSHVREHYGWYLGVPGALLGLYVLFLLICGLTFVDNYEFGFVFDKFTGEIQRVDHAGWVVRNPIRYDVHTIDTRPYQVNVSANDRILNAKLVRFNPKGLDVFIQWHGRSAGDNIGTLKEILKSYAFDRDGGASCPFLEVVSELSASKSAAEALSGKEKP